MAEFTLEANKREVGKQSQLTEIRDSSRVPAVIYGFSQEPLNVDFDYNTLLKVVKAAGSSNLINIKVDGKDVKVIVREYQQDPVTDRLIHIDFMAVDSKRKVSTKVPLEFVGVSKAVREQGGQLNVKTRRVFVQCLPDKLPSVVEVDISVFDELGKKLLIKDLKVEEGVEIMNDPNEPVADVSVPKKLRLKTPAEEAAEAAASEAKEGAEGEAAASEAKEGADKKEESTEENK